MIEDHLLKEDEIGDRVKVARIVQKLLDTSLGLPDRTWHDWDEWRKGLNDRCNLYARKQLMDKPVVALRPIVG
jgi:hypothetical protein